MFVLVSIQPKWCELIASGKKTVDVRKTKPKLETPFKVYIYCTIDGGVKGDMLVPSRLICGKVIGEFVCDRIFQFENSLFDEVLPEIVARSCVSMHDLLVYLGKQDFGYGWHISNLVIYDKPRELSEFYVWKKCNSCRISGYESTACCYDEYCRVPAVITRPPHSWCYVENEVNT